MRTIALPLFVLFFCWLDNAGAKELLLAVESSGTESERVSSAVKDGVTASGISVASPSLRKQASHVLVAKSELIFRGEGQYSGKRLFTFVFETVVDIHDSTGRIVRHVTLRNNGAGKTKEEAHQYTILVTLQRLPQQVAKEMEFVRKHCRCTCSD